MTLLNSNAWGIAAGSAVIAGAGALALWHVLRKRPSPEELEHARRLFLAQSGRLVDGMLLDVYEVEIPAKNLGKKNAEPARTLTMLLYSYSIGGVDYECSQDITALKNMIDTAQIRAGFPCSARYQPGNPQNSIVVSEEWSGLRMGLPVLPAFDDPEPVDLSHLRPGRG